MGRASGGAGGNGLKPMPGAEKNKTIPMTVTFLEMRAKPSQLPPPHPSGKVAILRAENPPIHFYRYLYDTIGKPYFWVDRQKMGDQTLAAIIGHSQVELYVLYADGCPAGMAELDFRDANIGLIAYFGLMPEYVGRRLGYFFLYHAVANAWAKPISTLLVNTCTLDHPRALPLYQRVGFTPYSREERCVELP